jgi:hypothetical protein
MLQNAVKPMKFLPLFSAMLLLSLAGCGAPEYAVPSQAVSEDIAASHWSGASDTSINTGQLLDFRDSDIDGRP